MGDLPEGKLVYSELTKEEKQKITEIEQYLTLANIGLILKNVCERIPTIFPNYRNWFVAEDVPELVYRILHENNFVASRIRSLKMMLGENYQNTMWASNVLIGQAVYVAISYLAEKYDKRFKQKF